MVSGKYKSRTFRRVKVKIPSGQTVIQYRKRNRKIAKCAITKKPLRGLKRMDNIRFGNLSRTKKTISRPFGGYMGHDALKKKIILDIISEYN